MNKIFVLGSINMDLVFTINQMPKKGETIQGKGFFMSPGGKGANQAVACAKQGAKTQIIGSIGDDELSQLCKTSLLDFGVDCTYISELEGKTCGVAGIILEQQDNRIITDSGANEIHNINSILNILNTEAKKSDILISQLEIPLDVILSTFYKAKEMHMFTILNAAPVKLLPESMYPLIDIIAVNEIEMEMLTGIAPNNQKQIREAAEHLLRLGVQSVLLTLGELGSVYVSRNEIIQVGAYSVDVVDTTAAGDTYIGAFASQLISGKSVKEAMKYATAASALSIQSRGAQVAIPTKDQTLKFMKIQGVK